MSVILLVTRNPNLEHLLKENLAFEQLVIMPTKNAAEVAKSVLSLHVDASIIDTQIGETDVEEVSRCLNGNHHPIPIVYLSSLEEQWIPGLLPLRPELDVVLTPPWEPAMIRETLTTLQAGEAVNFSAAVHFGNAKLDVTTQELHGVNGTTALTPTEFRLLQYLLRRRGQIVTIEELLDKVWQVPQGTGSPVLVRSHMRNVRSKLKNATSGDEIIRTVPRRGYRVD